MFGLADFFRKFTSKSGAAETAKLSGDLSHKESISQSNLDETPYQSDTNLQTQLQQALHSYRSAAFPVGLMPLDSAQSNQSSPFVMQNNHIKEETLVLDVELGFAALGEIAEIEAHLSAELWQAVKINAVVKLNEAAQFKHVKHIVLVASGKGGVGKSTTAVNIAQALQKEGGRVGILDADIYGPSVPHLLKVTEVHQPAVEDLRQDTHAPSASLNNKKTPALPLRESNGIKLQSIGYLVDEEQATIWRGPMASTALTQLLNDTDWGELDYLIVDMPPGTGDIQLTMTQKIKASGAVIVTTPEKLALADAQKGIVMFERVELPILGLIENMSYFICGNCDAKHFPFSQQGALSLAAQYNTSVLAQIPLDQHIREMAERGHSLFDCDQETLRANDAADEHSELNNNAGSQTEITNIYSKAARTLASQLFYQHALSSELEIIITDD